MRSSVPMGRRAAIWPARYSDSSALAARAAAIVSGSSGLRRMSTSIHSRNSGRSENGIPSISAITADGTSPPTSCTRSNVSGSSSATSDRAVSYSARLERGDRARCEGALHEGAQLVVTRRVHRDHLGLHVGRQALERDSRAGLVGLVVVERLQHVGEPAHDEVALVGVAVHGGLVAQVPVHRVRVLADVG